MRKRILSGLQPTGKIHLGNYAGALSNWVKLQDSHECYFMIADWHALTSEYADTSTLKENIKECIIDWLSVGLDPDRCTIFIQSQVKEHAELHLLLSPLTPLSWLYRNPTYKEQLKEVKDRDLANYGFLGYPVLQAADILIYKACGVPVGEDQLPHLELTREIARRFNHFYGEVFPLPEPILSRTPRLLGTDGRKMSKKYGNFIALADSPELIREKVMNMFTDPTRIRVKDPGHPETCNVFSYHKIYNPGEEEKIEKECRGAAMGCTQCKRRLAEVLIESLSGFRSARAKLERQPEKIEEILIEGARRARGVASQTMAEVREAMGIG